MSRVYFVRHGQAGTRREYDALSALGREQARLLGEYLAAQGTRFTHAWSGELVRQRQTAEEVTAAYAASGMDFPAVHTEPRWNEFDLDHVYRGLAPQMAAEDAQFRAEYEELQAQARAAEADSNAAVHRRWMPADIKVIAAWLRATHPYDGESFADFRDRVVAIRTTLAGLPPDSDAIVFTSATPIGIWAAHTIDVSDERVMKLAGTLHNASYTVIRFQESDPRLHTFNAVPHLNTAELRTYR